MAPDAAAGVAPDAATACPYCGACAAGRFCSACGKPKALAGAPAPALRELLGVRAPPWRALLRTAALAVADPAGLSRRWATGDRIGLASPLAMLSAVTAATALVGFLLARWTGSSAPAVDDVEAARGVLGVAGFLRGAFPGSFAAAAADPAGFAQHFKATGQLLVAFWPLLFILPGHLMLAPWRRVAAPLSLTMAAFETVTVMLLAGLHGALQAVEGLRGPLVTSLFWLLLWAHSAWHVRGAAATGWRYAIARPPLAALIFLPVVYIWVVAVAAMALASWSVTG